MNINRFKVGDQVEINLNEIHGEFHKESPRIMKVIEIVGNNMVRVFPPILIRFKNVSNNYYLQDLLGTFLLKKSNILYIDDNLFEL